MTAASHWNQLHFPPCAFLCVTHRGACCRCLKPNHQKQANLFQSELILAQLRYTGILETVRIRRQGYATRLLHDVFVDRFVSLSCSYSSLDLSTSFRKCELFFVGIDVSLRLQRKMDAIQSLSVKKKQYALSLCVFDTGVACVSPKLSSLFVLRSQREKRNNRTGSC